jgi:DNA-binding LacI/PurR family transcriptional regulator
VLGDVWQYQVDGVIAAARLPATTSPNSSATACRWCCSTACCDDLSVHTVSCDHRAAGRMLAARLAAAGHRQFGIISGSKDSASPSRRQQGVANNWPSWVCHRHWWCRANTITAAAQQA